MEMMDSATPPWSISSICRAAVARFLLRKGEETGQDARGGLFIPLALSRQELADMMGTTIETAIRVMSRWGKTGLVATREDGFVVLDKERLADIAGG